MQSEIDPSDQKIGQITESPVDTPQQNTTKTSKKKFEMAFLAFFVLLIPIALLAATSQTILFNRASAPLTPPTLPTVTPFPTPRPGAYRLELSNNKINMTCSKGDVNCFYQSTLRPINNISQPLYRTTLYTSSSGGSLQYTNASGAWTSGQTILNNTVNPGGAAINTLVKAIPPAVVGVWNATLYVDGQTCNTRVTPPDCYYYGATQLNIKITVIDGPVPTATATLRPTITPTQRPSITPTRVPTAIPTRSVTPTPAAICSILGTAYLDYSQTSEIYAKQLLNTGWGTGDALKYSPTRKGKIDKIELYVSGNGMVQAKVVDSKGVNLTDIVTKTINSTGGWQVFDFTTEPLVSNGLTYTVTFRSASGQIYIHRGPFWNWARKIWLKPCFN